MHTETYIADDNATLISKSFRDLKKYLDMVSYGQISIPYLTRFKKVIINNARSDFCVDEVKLLLSRGILQDAEAVEIKNPDDRFCTIDGMLYSGNKQKLYLCPRGKTGNLVIHDGAELICDYACAWVRCDQVTIPDSVKSIGENAFAFNLNLKKVEGGRNIQNIKPFAFYRCYRLKRFEFGEKLKIIGSSAFDYASLNEMKEIKFPNGLKTIGGGAFNTIDIIEDKETRPVDYDQMYTVYLPETVTHIGTTAFPNASAIHMSKQTAKCLMNDYVDCLKFIQIGLRGTNLCHNYNCNIWRLKIDGKPEVIMPKSFSCPKEAATALRDFINTENAPAPTMYTYNSDCAGLAAAIEHCKLYSDTKSKKFITRNISTIMYNVFHTEPDGEQFMIGLIKDGVLTDTALRKMLSKMDKDTYLKNAVILKAYVINALSDIKCNFEL